MQCVVHYVFVIVYLQLCTPDGNLKRKNSHICDQMWDLVT